MAQSAGRLDIYNMALGFIGTRTVASANENTPEAIQCSLFWDRARRSALRDFPYNFAQGRVELAQKMLPHVYAGEWRYAYAMPVNALKVHKVFAPGRSAEGSPFCVHHSGAEANGGSIILCSVQNAQAECTFDIEDISLWDELFIMAMARKLACLIAIPLLKNNPQKLQELVQLYQKAIPEAQGQDASESRGSKSADTWLCARGAW